MGWAKNYLKSRSNGKEKRQFEIKHEDRYIMENLRPDFLAIDNVKISLVYAWFVFELQTKKTIDYEHKGKTINYNIQVLEANVRRSFIISVVTNMSIMHLVKSERTVNGIRHLISKEIEFWPLGMSFILQMLDNPSKAGYDPSIIFRINIDKYYEFKKYLMKTKNVLKLLIYLEYYTTELL